jgi:glycerol-3-phosphate dehydrogenase (NAD(P)+)
LARTDDEARRIRKDGENRRFLPGTPLPSTLEVTASSSEALADAGVVILAVPSQRFRQNLLWIRDSLHTKAIAVSAAKGLELQTGKPMSAVFADEMPPSLARRYCVLSGPNLAKEVIAGKPASTVVASKSRKAAKRVQGLLMSPRFRIYTNDDVIGVELAGALKNIIALGSGICDGLEYGDNAKAAFITRGLAEITRLGVFAGANPLTFAGLAGLGDVSATCFSRLSRNRYVGEELATGRTLSEILESMENVAEGVHTTAAALKLARRLGVEMPIVEATHQILFEGLELNEAVARLMGRPPRSE